MHQSAFLPFRHELIVDNFAGGGGASTGIEAAFGRPVDIAVNHDGAALAMHAANHPKTRHLCSDVFEVDPLEVTNGQPVGLAWFSPDCSHFSKAKGGKPQRDKKIRGLAWVVIRWAKTVKPRVIMLENVEEFQDWGPLLKDGTPCPMRKGLTFRRWIAQLKSAGYEIEWRELRACDYGAPTIRKRLFVIARCDGETIVWPRVTHGKGRGLRPYRTAAECIDWSIPCRSIFERKRPLADATMRRIARGMFKYVINAARPFIVPGTHAGDSRVHSIDEPFRTITSAHRGELAVVAPTLINTRNGERDGQAPRVRDIAEPYSTVTSKGSQGALVAAFLAKHYDGNYKAAGIDMRDRFGTVTSRDHHALVTSHLVKLKGTSSAVGVDEPMHTIAAGGCHFGEVRAFLTQFNGGDGRGIVTIAGVDYHICDIGMRMLEPRELFNAQGFRRDYEIRPVFRGAPLTKEQQIRLCGNSVAPDVAEALVRANFAHEEMYEAVTA